MKTLNTTMSAAKPPTFAAAPKPLKRCLRFGDTQQLQALEELKQEAEAQRLREDIDENAPGYVLVKCEELGALHNTLSDLQEGAWSTDEEMAGALYTLRKEQCPEEMELEEFTMTISPEQFDAIIADIYTKNGKALDQCAELAPNVDTMGL